MLQTDEQITFSEKLLSRERWTWLRSAHEKIISDYLDPYLDKRSRQMKDPVLDFLFEYYAFRPSHLKRWSPGTGVVLEFDEYSELPEISELKTEKGLAWLGAEFFPQKRISSLNWTLEMLDKSGDKNPFFGCFGMHEWAMVYRADEVRHGQIPLRLSDKEIADFVESRPLLCTHFDAFRFFTEKARPLNRHTLSREKFDEMEQPGCVHTNMDLYKWAYKLHPWISSEILHEAFFNAVEARKIDMQASPYDATCFGLKPIKIETEEGRKEYLEKQMEIYKRSQPVRDKVIAAYRNVLSYINLNST